MRAFILTHTLNICLLGLGLCTASPAFASGQIELCFNYGCKDRMQITYTEHELAPLRRHLRPAKSAAAERIRLSETIGHLYMLAARRSPIGADQAGNYEDDEINGRMDCIDHSTNTTAMLRMLDSRGWIKFHKVGEPVERARFIFEHFSALLEEKSVTAPAQYVMDSWFVAPGRPAVVLPLQEWQDGGGPDVQ